MTQKISFARPGNRLSARHYNRVVAAANLALEVLNPARSTRLPEAVSANPTLNEDGSGSLEGITTQLFTEQSRTTSTVRVTSSEDPDVYVDVDRIDSVTLRSETEELTLVFNNT